MGELGAGVEMGGLNGKRNRQVNQIIKKIAYRELRMSFGDLLVSL